MNDDRSHRSHGGKRPGAGRKKQVRAATDFDDATVRFLIADAEPDDIETTAQRHARLAVAALVKKLVAGANEGSRVAAANAILDRGYGKPVVNLGGDSAMLPFLAVPGLAVPVSSEIRAEARKYANLALETLRLITEFGRSEAAIVSAAKSLLDRGLGTVGPAQLPDNFDRRPLGKKEAAARAAEVASTSGGRYATPPGPKKSPSTDDGTIH